MEKIGNVEFYNDDLEIIEILQLLPEMKEWNNMNILRFIEQKTVGANFGTVVFHQKTIYTIYKFDIKHFGPKGAGLVLTKSKESFANEQLMIWTDLKNAGMSLSPKIFESIYNILFASMITQNFYNRK